MTQERVYVLVAVDKTATGGNPFVEMVNRCLSSELFTDQFAVADVTDAVYLHSGSSVYINGCRIWALDE